MILQPHLLLAAVPFVTAVAQYADLCRWEAERDDLRLCLEESNLESGGSISEKCQRIYGEVMLEESQ